MALAEVLVASVVATLVVGGAVAFLWGQAAAGRAQPETADLQQRARVVAEVLGDAFASAGAWADHGAPLTPVSCCLPVVQPRRIGSRAADPPGTVRADTVTILRARSGATPARVDRLAAGVLTLRPELGCAPAARPACGLAVGDHMAILNRLGTHAFFVVDTVSDLEAQVAPREASTTPVDNGLAIAVETLTFSVDPVARQLRVYDGYRSDMPVVDDVVAARFEYFGDAGVPARARAESESCWFDADQQPRFGRLETAPGSALVPLPLAGFQDGPWCGEGDNRFDADLLRIRAVRATVRLQAAAAAARGTTADYFTPGVATSGLALVPDLEVVVDGTPRATSHE